MTDNTGNTRESELGSILRALAFAAHKHRDQRRKNRDASPYINHPIAVADVLVNVGGISDTNTLCAALLHDTLEDTETSIEELLGQFGPEIVAIVVEVTDDKTLPKQQRKQLQIESASALSDRAKQVKLADKICNLRDLKEHPPVDWPLTRKLEYFDWAKRVVDALRGVSPALERAFDDIHASPPDA